MNRSTSEDVRRLSELRQRFNQYGNSGLLTSDVRWLLEQIEGAVPTQEPAQEGSVASLLAKAKEHVEKLAQENGALFESKLWTIHESQEAEKAREGLAKSIREFKEEKARVASLESALREMLSKGEMPNEIILVVMD